MASRAHSIHDHFDYEHRPRRAVRYPGDDDPVVLPRDKSAGTGLALAGSALVAVALIAGGGYAISTVPSVPELAVTPALPVTTSWQPDAEAFRARALAAVQGPAYAVPSVQSAPEAADDADAVAPEPLGVDGPAIAPSAPRPREPGSVEDSPSSSRPAPESGPTAPVSPDPALEAPTAVPPEATPVIPYPNPTTTPPDEIAPPQSGGDVRTPGLDPENPYR